jgi:hypothetical protein
MSDSTVENIHVKSCSDMSDTLPYYRKHDSLPADLPTKQEIEEASEELPCIHNSTCCRIVVVNQLFVVKYGTYVSETEGHALLYF